MEIEEPGRLGPFLPSEGHWDRWDPGIHKKIIFRHTGCTLIYKFRKQWGEGKRVLVTGPPERLKQGYALGIHLMGGTPPTSVQLPESFAAPQVPKAPAFVPLHASPRAPARWPSQWLAPAQLPGHEPAQQWPGQWHAPSQWPGQLPELPPFLQVPPILQANLPPAKPAATIADLVRMAHKEMVWAFLNLKIHKAITHHTSADSIKPLAWGTDEDSYDDYGNYNGSLLMLMMLFPAEYQLNWREECDPAPVVDFVDQSWAGDRKWVLHEEGKYGQKSGEGQNNYRTNLLEALLSDMRASGYYGTHIQELWKQIGIYNAENVTRLPESQKENCKEMLLDLKDVLGDEVHCLTMQVMSATGLGYDEYWNKTKAIVIAMANGTEIHSYSDIMNVSKSGFNSAKRLWPAVEKIKSSRADGALDSPEEPEPGAEEPQSKPAPPPPPPPLPPQEYDLRHYLC